MPRLVFWSAIGILVFVLLALAATGRLNWAVLLLPLALVFCYLLGIGLLRLVRAWGKAWRNE